VCSDRKIIALHLSSQPKFWESLVAAIERPELATDERFKNREGRVSNYPELEAELASVFSERPRIEWMTRLEAADIPFAPVQEVREVLDDPQVRHLGTFYEEVHPTEGALKLSHRPVWIDANRRISARPPPALGEHTEEVLAGLRSENGR
jgi:formyl-CoA transferase